MQLTLDIPDETAAALESRGVHVVAFVQALLDNPPQTIPNVGRSGLLGRFGSAADHC